MVDKSHSVKKPTGSMKEADDQKCGIDGPQAIQQDEKPIVDLVHRDDHDVEMKRSDLILSDVENQDKSPGTERRVVEKSRHLKQRLQKN